MSISLLRAFQQVRTFFTEHRVHERNTHFSFATAVAATVTGVMGMSFINVMYKLAKENKLGNIVMESILEMMKDEIKKQAEKSAEKLSEELR